MRRSPTWLVVAVALGAALAMQNARKRQRPPPRPAKRSEAFRQTLPALKAGFGEADITPPLDKGPVYIAGFGHNRKALKAHDPLFARAVVLNDGKQKIALVSVDLVGFFRDNVRNVRKELPGFHHVLVSSTHTHEGPDTLGLWGPNPLASGADPAYLKRVEEQVVKAVKQADGRAAPVKASLGTVKAPELLHDSREPEVKHDELVALMLRSTKDNRPAGVVVQWNCHPETLDSKSRELSADYVGVTVARLRERWKCPAVYFTGTVGGLMTTIRVPVKDSDGKALPEGSWQKTERYGVLLADKATRALERARAVRLTPIEARTREVFVPMDNKLYALARQVGVLKRDAYLWSGDPSKAEPAPPGETKKPLCMKTEVGLLRLGDLEIAAIPGEIYPELVLGKVQDPVDPGADFPQAPVEPGIYAQMRGPHKMLVGLANDEIGYIIPKRQWDLEAPYCYGRKKAQYGEVNSVGPEAAPILCGAFRSLAKVGSARR